MRRMWVGLAAGLLGLLLMVPAASGRAEGWSSGSYETAPLLTGAVTFAASQTSVSFFLAAMQLHCTGTCSGSPTLNLGVRIPGTIPISSTGKFRATVNTQSFTQNVSSHVPITVSVDGQLSGKRATGTVQFGGANVNGDQYSGGQFTFTAALGGGVSMFRAYGDVAFNASQPYGYVGASVTVTSLSQVAQDIASVGARTLRTWSSRSSNCKTMQNVATSPVSADGSFVNTRTYRFSVPGIYTICADLLDSTGSSVTPPVSVPISPPWPVSPILICPHGTIIEYNAAVSIGCKRRR